MKRCLLALAACATLSAQWVNYPAKGVPRDKAGKPILTAKAPRAANGKPDLSGVWHVKPMTLAEAESILGDISGRIEVPGMEIDTISKYAINIFMDFKPGEAPLRPEAEAILRGHDDRGLPSTRCLPLGIPLATHLSEFWKLSQTPDLIVILLELNNSYRQIHIDGRKLPADPSPSWFGYSTGRWEGDTLVVETNGLNDKSWLDVMGHPQSESMHITERFRRVDFGHMEVATTMDDPTMYTKPFTIKVIHELHPDSDVLEYVCNENEVDRVHMGLK